MDFFDDYSDADPNHKSIRGNGITTFLFHVSLCIIFNLKNHDKKILIANVSLKIFYSCFNLICWIENNTLGNMKDKCSDTISPNAFVIWISIRIIIKETHFCSCKFWSTYFLGFLNKKTQQLISYVDAIHWIHPHILTQFISVFIIYRIFCSGCVCIWFVNIIKWNLFVFF